MRADVSKNVSTCKKFFTLELEARIVAATMIELGIGEMSQTPSTSPYFNLDNMCNKAKVDCLNSLAAKVVDTYILRKDKVETILEKTCEAQNAEKQQGERFPCRFSGCQKSFKHDGKRRREYKKTHGGFVAEQHSKSSANNLQNVAKGSDDMFNYQSSFLVQSFKETLQYCDEWRKFTSVIQRFSHSVIQSFIV